MVTSGERDKQDLGINKLLYIKQISNRDLPYSTRNYIQYLVRTKSLQPCPTLCDSMDCNPQGSSVHGILQAGILEWVAMPFSRDIQYLVGKESEKENLYLYVYIYISESLCYTPETNITFKNQLYFNGKKKRNWCWKRQFKQWNRKELKNLPIYLGSEYVMDSLQQR